MRSQQLSKITTHPKFEDVRFRILQRARLSSGRNRKYEIGVGNFKLGNVLIVGERPNIKTWKPGRDHHAFCALNNSSWWLNLQLEELKINEDSLYWVNSHFADGRPIDIDDLVLKLQPSMIIALGGIASKILSKYEHEKIPHPSYWKRFHNKKPYPLMKLLSSQVN